MSTPSDPQQPQHPQQPQQPQQPQHPQQPQQPSQWPSTGEQPAYPAQPYGYQQPTPYGYPQYGGYPPYGGYPGQPPYGPPRRPGTLIAAGMLWLLMAVLMLLLGIVSLLADRISGFDEVYENNPDITPELVRGFGLVATTGALTLMAFGIAVFSGALWARIASAVVGGLLGLVGIGFLAIPPLLAIIAIVLQFLPASNAYARARRERTT